MWHAVPSAERHDSAFAQVSGPSQTRRDRTAAAGKPVQPSLAPARISRRACGSTCSPDQTIAAIRSPSQPSPVSAPDSFHRAHNNATNHQNDEFALPKNDPDETAFSRSRYFSGTNATQTTHANTSHRDGRLCHRVHRPSPRSPHPVVAPQKVDHWWPNALRVAQRRSVCDAFQLDVMCTRDRLGHLACTSGERVGVQLESHHKTRRRQPPRAPATDPGTWR